MISLIYLHFFLFFPPTKKLFDVARFEINVINRNHVCHDKSRKS